MPQYIILFLLIFSSFVLASKPITRFEHLSIKDGMSQSVVYSIIQDSKGFLWFATGDGLNRYDGYGFKVFHHDPQNPASISNNLTTTLYEDSKGLLWVGTRGGGLNVFNPSTESFSHFTHNPSDPNSLSHDSVRSFFADNQGFFWIGTDGGGLNRFDQTSQQFKRFSHQSTDPNSLSNNRVFAIEGDGEGNLWLGTAGGLNHFEPSRQKFTHYTHQPFNPNSLSDDSVYTLHQHTSGLLWVGTGNGLNRFDKQSRRFERFKHNSNNAHSISHNDIKSLFEDSKGILWIGTQSGGLNKYVRAQNNFVHFKNYTGEPYSLSGDTILSIFEDNRGVLWFGSFGNGANKLDRQKQRFGHINRQPSQSNRLSHNTVLSIHKTRDETLWIGTVEGLNQYNSRLPGFIQFKHQPDNPASLSHNQVWSTIEDDEGFVWAATHGGGLDRFDSVTQSFVHFKHLPDDPTSLSNNIIRRIFKDKQGNIWIGTEGGGINRYHPSNQSFSHYRHDINDPQSLSHDIVYTFFEDSKGYLWIGTEGGLNRLDVSTGLFTRYQYNKAVSHSLSHNFISSIHEDTQGSLWVATFGGGLNKFDELNGNFTRYRQKDGLANDTINAMIEDQQGYLWLSTNKGLSKFNLDKQTFKNYDVNDGLQSNEFNLGASFKSDDGELFFGGVNGFNRFYPQNIKDDTEVPTVVLTDFLVANQSVTIKPTTQQDSKTFSLPMNIDALKHLTLTHRQNLITFEFVALHFANPMKNRYAYQLVGQDEDWIHTDAKHRRATYTNLADGDYVFRVKASNKDGYWNEQGKSLNVTILPPPWKSWWAYCFYVLCVVAVVTAFVRVQRKNVVQERAINVQLKQVNTLKDEFLANTSHELRTPLNGIIGLAESLIDGIGGPLSKTCNSNLSMIISSGKRLSNLVNDILDFSKLKNHNLTLDIHPVDLHSMAEVVLTLSRPLLGDKDLKLVNAVPTELSHALADENRLAQIFHNLIGNAIKFTESGTVTVTAETVNKGINNSNNSNNKSPISDTIKISVSDSGIGIAKDRFDIIFESFEQLESHTERNYSGTGLGLAVTRQLIELHGGHISVTSEPNRGSTFSFTLPLSDEKATAHNEVAHLHLRDEQ
ncbi:MAG: GGDEF domain-containing protein, partial [Algicola sp.]|nr:GGDEF domain-containing protein [Algicola sp.]